MRILLVNERCGYFGGVEQNIADTVVGLRARGHLCYLAYGSSTEIRPTEYASLFDGTCRYSDLAVAPSPATDHSPFFSEISSEFSPDVVYVHKVPSIKCFLPSVTGRPALRMIHDHDICCPRRHKYFLIGGKICRKKAGWRCWLDGAFLVRSTASPWGIGWSDIRWKLREMQRNFELSRLLVGSVFMREELIQNGFEADKVHILPPVVRMPDRSPTPVPSEPRILFVGQLIRGKGVDLLLRALARLNCDFTAAIVGAGNARIELESLSRELGLAGRVEFTGWVDREAIEQHYDRARILAVPARWPEPFGMIGLEAMHRGRPVVAFAVGGIPDWLEHGRTGFLVPEQDCGAFADALTRLLREDALAASMGWAGYETVRSRFDFDRYLEHLEEHLVSAGRGG